MKLLLSWISCVFVLNEITEVASLDFLNFRNCVFGNDIIVTGENAERLLDQEEKDWQIRVERAKKKVQRLAKASTYTPHYTDVNIQKLALKKLYLNVKKSQYNSAIIQLEKINQEKAESTLCFDSKEKTNFCERAFENSFFENNNLHYVKSWREPCHSMPVIISGPGPDSLTQIKRYMRKCSAIEEKGNEEKGNEENGNEENGTEKTDVNVYISSSKQYRKGKNLKFYVFIDKNENKGFLNAVTSAFSPNPLKVSAFLANKS